MYQCVCHNQEGSGAHRRISVALEEALKNIATSHDEPSGNKETVGVEENRVSFTRVVIENLSVHTLIRQNTCTRIMKEGGTKY